MAVKAFWWRLLFDPAHPYTRSVLIPAIVVFEAVFSVLIVNRVACTTTLCTSSLAANH
jgi:hypothetical protein